MLCRFPRKQESIQLLSDLTGHVLTAAERGFDLAVPVWALGDLYFSAIIKFQHIVYQRGITLCTGCIHCHSTLVTFVRGHFSLLLICRSNGVVSENNDSHRDAVAMGINS